MAGRPRQFNRDDALETAMRQFWAGGYEQTTVSALTEAIGVAAPSLYAAFGDKDRLFDEAAESYAERTEAGARRALDQSTAAEGIAELLRVTAAAHSDPATPPGCLVLTEPRLADRRAHLRGLIAERIARGVAEGDIPDCTDPWTLADYLMAVMTGMSARARDGGGAEEIRAIADTALSALTPQLAPGTTSPLS